LNENIKNKFISKSRLNVYDSFEKYERNLRLSKKYYILLAVLEVSLRNSISYYFTNYIDNNWLNNHFLNLSSQRKIEDVKLRLNNKQNDFSSDKIISELSFGFWTALFRKDNASIMRIKTIKKIFPNLPNQNDKFINRNYINKKLNHIRIFRNRIFHYEKIVDKKEFFSIENDILEILEYFDEDVKKFALMVNSEENIL